MRLISGAGVEPSPKSQVQSPKFKVRRPKPEDLGLGTWDFGLSAHHSQLDAPWPRSNLAAMDSAQSQFCVPCGSLNSKTTHNTKCRHLIPKETLCQP